MQNIMKDMLLFVEVATCKSFTQAANHLDMPTSTISRRIATLEKSLGVRLFNRNSRKVELTEAGKTFFTRCDFIVTEARLAREELTSASKTISGKIRMATPPDFCLYCGDILIDFAKAYPDISLDIHSRESWADLIGDPYDLDIRVGELPSSNLFARKLNEFATSLFASPLLFQSYPIPEHPNDLLSLPTMRVRYNTLWHLKKGSQSVSVAPQSRFTVNSVSLLSELATAGLGVTELGTHLGQTLTQDGLLVPVLPEWKLPSVSIYAVTASREIPTRVSLLIDFLHKRLQASPASRQYSKNATAPLLRKKANF